MSDCGSAAELLARVARLSQGDGDHEGLTPAQWAALRYFAMANAGSRTVSAFANYHATTRGPASQTIKGLVDRGLLERTRSSTDGRSACLDLTRIGRRLLPHDPLRTLASAIADLPETTRRHLVSGLERLMIEVADHQGRPTFGICPDCMHFRESDGPGLPATCGCTGGTVPARTRHELCIDFRPWHEAE